MLRVTTQLEVAFDALPRHIWQSLQQRGDFCWAVGFTAPHDFVESPQLHGASSARRCVGQDSQGPRPYVRKIPILRDWRAVAAGDDTREDPIRLTAKWSQNAFRVPAIAGSVLPCAVPARFETPARSFGRYRSTARLPAIAQRAPPVFEREGSPLLCDASLPTGFSRANRPVPRRNFIGCGWGSAIGPGLNFGPTKVRLAAACKRLQKY